MYIGKTPTVGNFQVCDAISVVNGQAAYTLQVGGTNVAPESANHMLVSLNGILQKPGSSFTISGSTMTFASNLATGDVIDFVQILGNVLDIGQPSDDTVKTASLQANAVTAAKLNNDIVSGLTALGATPADTDEFLISDAGTIKRIDYSYIKSVGITEFDYWEKVDSDQSISADTTTTITGWQRSNRTGWVSQYIGTGMSHSSGTFTFGQTGKYIVIVGLTFSDSDTNNYVNCQIHATDNGSSYAVVAQQSTFFPSSGSTRPSSVFNTYPFDVTATNTVKFRIRVFGHSDFQVDTDSDRASNHITIIRLGDT